MPLLRVVFCSTHVHRLLSVNVIGKATEYYERWCLSEIAKTHKGSRRLSGKDKAIDNMVGATRMRGAC
jgi:hypothetical protein